MGKLILYGSHTSPSTRGVLLTLKELELEFEFKLISVKDGENRTEEFLKKNPQHTIPLLEDDDHYIWDSHAIITYLARKYGKTDSLYPKDFFQRAVVDQRLHFESGVLFTRALKGFMSPHLSREEKVESVVEAYGFLEAFLQDTYLAADHLTIADLSILPTATTLNLIVPIDAEKTPKLSAWLQLLTKLPYYKEINEKGLELAAEKFKAFIVANGE